MISEQQTILSEIDAFVRETGMGEAYFGQLAVGNSKLVSRLRKGGSIQIETAERIRTFIRSRLSVVEESAA